MEKNLQLDGQDNSGSILLVVSSEANRQLLASRNGPWTRLAARLLASHLDEQLARGRAPESNRLLAARAQELVAPETRGEVARLWRRLTVEASKPATMCGPRRLLNRGAVCECVDHIQELCDRLTEARPVSARSVAMALTFLEDGTGPVYSRRSSTSLSAAIGEIIDELEPGSIWESGYGALVG